MLTPSNINTNSVFQAGTNTYDPLRVAAYTGGMDYMPSAQFLTPAEYGTFAAPTQSALMYAPNGSLSFMQNLVTANPLNPIGSVPGLGWMSNVPYLGAAANSFMNYNWYTYNPTVSQLDYLSTAQARLQDSSTMFKANMAGFATKDVIAGGLASAAGAKVGASVGSMIMPGVGTVVGGLLGVLGGYWLSDKITPDIGAIVGDRIRGASGIQLATMGHVSGGSDVNSKTGLGFSRDAAYSLDTFLRRSAARDPLMKIDDYREMLFQGLDNEMFAGTQSVAEYKDKISKIRKSMHTFMEVVGSTDMKEIFKDLKRLRAMGVSENQYEDTLRMENTFARMTGMRHAEMVGTYGAMGATAAHMYGLDASQGSLGAIALYSGVKRLVRSGEISARQLSLAGGEMGTTKTALELANATFHNTFYDNNGGAGSFLAALADENGVVTKESAGKFVRDVMSGRLGKEDLIREASRRLTMMSSDARNQYITAKGETFRASRDLFKDVLSESGPGFSGVMGQFVLNTGMGITRGEGGAEVALAVGASTASGTRINADAVPVMLQLIKTMENTNADANRRAAQEKRIADEQKLLQEASSRARIRASLAGTEESITESVISMFNGVFGTRIGAAPTVSDDTGKSIVENFYTNGGSTTTNYYTQQVPGIAGAPRQGQSQGAGEPAPTPFSGFGSGSGSAASPLRPENTPNGARRNSRITAWTAHFNESTGQYELPTNYSAEEVEYLRTHGVVDGLDPHVRELIHKYAESEGMLEYETVLQAIAMQESGGKHTKNGKVQVSSGGAIGVMQVTPSAGKDGGISKSQLYDVDMNVLAGVREFKRNIGRYNGDVRKAILAYNTGVGNLNSYLAKGTTMGYRSEASGRYIPPHPLLREQYQYIDAVLGRITGLIAAQIIEGSGTSAVGLGAITGDIARELDNLHIPYRSGGNSFRGMDCSHLARLAYENLMRATNYRAGKQVFSERAIKEAAGVWRQSGELVENIAHITGRQVLSGDDMTPEAVARSGVEVMAIGLDSGNTNHEGKGRFGMDHTAVLYKDADGVYKVLESSGTKGVHITTYEKWYDTYAKKPKVGRNNIFGAAFDPLANGPVNGKPVRSTAIYGGYKNDGISEMSPNDAAARAKIGDFIPDLKNFSKMSVFDYMASTEKTYKVLTELENQDDNSDAAMKDISALRDALAKHGVGMSTLDQALEDGGYNKSEFSYGSDVAIYHLLDRIGTKTSWSKGLYAAKSDKELIELVRRRGLLKGSGTFADARDTAVADARRARNTLIGLMTKAAGQASDVAMMHLDRFVGDGQSAKASDFILKPWDHGVESPEAARSLLFTAAAAQWATYKDELSGKDGYSGEIAASLNKLLNLAGDKALTAADIESVVDKDSDGKTKITELSTIVDRLSKGNRPKINMSGSLMAALTDADKIVAGRASNPKGLGPTHHDLTAGMSGDDLKSAVYRPLIATANTAARELIGEMLGMDSVADIDLTSDAGVKKLNELYSAWDKGNHDEQTRRRFALQSGLIKSLGGAGNWRQRAQVLMDAMYTAADISIDGSRTPRAPGASDGSDSSGPGGAASEKTVEAITKGTDEVVRSIDRGNEAVERLCDILLATSGRYLSSAEMSRFMKKSGVNNPPTVQSPGSTDGAGK